MNITITTDHLCFEAVEMSFFYNQINIIEFPLDLPVPFAGIIVFQLPTLVVQFLNNEAVSMIHCVSIRR